MANTPTQRTLPQLRELLRFTVPTVPVAQPRQRHRIIHRDGKALSTNYTPTKSSVNAYKAAVQLALRQQYDGPPLKGPLSVDFEYVLPRPSNKTWKTKPMPRYPHTKKPDKDNLDKSTKDALNKLLWRDDAQVFDGRSTKWVAAGDEQPHVVITVRALDAED